jgi:hypothetical protein
MLVVSLCSTEQFPSLKYRVSVCLLRSRLWILLALTVFSGKITEYGGLCAVLSAPWVRYRHQDLLTGPVRQSEAVLQMS